MAAAARQLQQATFEKVSEDIRISSAFLSGYNVMQGVQPLYSGKLDDHPLASIVRRGAACLELAESDLNLGLRLRDWEDYARYMLEPSPVCVEGAIAWARRVSDAALRLRVQVSGEDQLDKGVR